MDGHRIFGVFAKGTRLDPLRECAQHADDSAIIGQQLRQRMVFFWIEGPDKQRLSLTRDDQSRGRRIPGFFFKLPE